MALITIGIPVYNEEAFLEKAIESAIHQTFKDIRIIISDNCSIDRSYEIASYYAQQDSRIELIRQPENIGPAKNFLYSLEKADSKYFVWLGAHDIFCDRYIEEAILALENSPDVAMAYPKSVMIDPQDQVIGDSYTDISTIGLPLSEGLLKVAQNLLYCTSFHGVFRTNVLKKLPIEQSIASDHLMLFMAATYGRIKMLDLLGILRRQARNETYEEAKERWINWGVYNNQNQVNPYATTGVKHFEHLWRRDAISVADKLTVSLGLKDIFFRRFGVTWSDLISEASRLSTTIPGLVEALTLESFQMNSSTEIDDYLSCGSPSELVNGIHSKEHLLRQQQIRLIHVYIESGEQSDAAAHLFKDVSYYDYDWFAFRGESWHPISQPSESCQTYIALPKASLQMAKIVATLKNQLLANQFEVKRLSEQLSQSNVPTVENPNLQAKIERLQVKLDKLQTKLERSQSKLRQANELIQSMERSKFWRLRRGWLRIKGAVRAKLKG